VFLARIVHKLHRFDHNFSLASPCPALILKNLAHDQELWAFHESSHWLYETAMEAIEDAKMKSNGHIDVGRP
jgi:hypothetical protein